MIYRKTPWNLSQEPAGIVIARRVFACPDALAGSRRGNLILYSHETFYMRLLRSAPNTAPAVGAGVTEKYSSNLFET
jgi:hypothetical protein